MILILLTLLTSGPAIAGKLKISEFSVKAKMLLTRGSTEMSITASFALPENNDPSTKSIRIFWEPSAPPTIILPSRS
jgi:hypothetical protein